MIVFVGNEIKLGGLTEVAEQRLKEKIVCISENYDIVKQENDILRDSNGAAFIVYDTESYLNDAEEVISIIKRIYRANKAKPVILVPTDNPKNEIIKTAVDAGIKLFVNTSLSLGEQKDSFEKALLGFYEGNKSETVAGAEEVILEENREIKSFIGDLYDAKQREEERENTVIIKKKGTAEVLIGSGATLIRTIVSIILLILASIGAATLLYPDIRSVFLKEFMHVFEVVKNIL